MTEKIKGAIIQRDRETYAIVPRSPAGIVKPENLENIIKTVRKYNIPIIKMTSGQRMVLVGIKEEDIDKVKMDLGMPIGEATAPCLHYVQTCPGTAVCKFGNQDSLSLGLEIEELYRAMDLHAKLKIGVSGCPRCCGESYMRDIGVFGSGKGWTVIFGGNSGGRPRIGDKIAKDLTKDETLDLIRRLLEYYWINGKSGERTARFMERIGFERLNSELLAAIPYIPTE
ncbi:MAG: NAD(P)/FAD-dependent oxidoreductase [Methanomicrobiaceae archaeon]|nr:NAD(P)/FAD-dependent oxidoreductase [Methanomicrobiaceae archaeon]